MGRGNCCVHGKYEGLFFIDWDNFSNEYENEDDGIITNYKFQKWESSLYEFIADFKEKFKSFTSCDQWINREEKAILENELFYVVTEDNEWSMAVKLIQKEQDYYKRGNIENLQAGLYKKYLEGMKNCWFNQFEEIGIYSGAWTSGTIKRAA